MVSGLKFLVIFSLVFSPLAKADLVSMFDTSAFFIKIETDAELVSEYPSPEKQASGGARFDFVHQWKSENRNAVAGATRISF